jgi:hypothetical protein
MRDWNWARGMAQIVARRWSSLTALNPRTGKFFWGDYSTNHSGVRLLDLFFLPRVSAGHIQPVSPTGTQRRNSAAHYVFRSDVLWVIVKDARRKLRTRRRTALV